MEKQAISSIERLRAIADRYDAFIVDLWGVVHDGNRAFTGAIDCLAALKRASKSVLLMSNSTRRSHAAVLRLEGLGISRDLYDHILTSGEETWRALKTRGAPDAAPFYRTLGRRCFLYGDSLGACLLRGTDLQRVADIAAADLVLCTGLFDRDEAPDLHRAILRAAVARGLAMICANPDIVVASDKGFAHCAGAVADLYERLGGVVVYHGKPHPAIYAEARARLTDVPPPRVLCIGDSLATDIVGASATGMASLLVAAGIHHRQLEHPSHGGVDPGRLADLCATVGVQPTYIAPRLSW